MIVVALAACGGKAKIPPPAPHAKIVAEAAPKPAKGLDVFELLHEVDGQVPGLEALSTKRQPDRTRCGGLRVVTTRDPNKPIAKEDEDFAALFELSFPQGLDFADGPNRAGSLDRFNQWVAEVTRTADVARQHYAALTQHADETGRVIAVARLVQIHLRIAQLFLRAEMPVDVRSGEFAANKQTAFCGKMAETAEAMLAGAEQAAAACASHVPSGSTAWWASVCRRWR
jgi:hypothetical protein